MGKMVLLSFLLICLQSYGQNKDIHKNYQYKTNKRTVYGIDLTVPGPYELYINDIAARKDYSGGMHNTFIEVNPYVLKSGTYTFRLKVFPEPSDLEKGGIQPTTVEFIQVGLASYEKTGDKTQAESYSVTKQFPVKQIKTPMHYFEMTGEFTVEVPYELEGWSNGQDLSKLDQKELEKKVVAFYEKARTILNNGDAETWMKLIEKRTKETYLFNYTPSNDKEFLTEKEMKIVNERTKNNMLHLEDYSIHIYANGQIISMERNGLKRLNNSSSQIKGWSPLIRNFNNVNTSTGMYIYLPQDSDEFVIIRK